MPMKKIMNKASDMVSEMCRGLILSHPDLDWDKKYNFIFRKNLRKNKVILISGGGSGHEPAHGGFVGEGMLDAAVCGDIFASPSQVQIYQAIKKTGGNQGVLLIIKNYSGDMMNFRNAAYMAQEDGIDVEYVKVDDDIAVKDSLYTVGRRGVAGTIFVHKIAGAAAEKGYDLKRVKAIAEKTAQSVRTIGFAFSSCTVPAKGTPTFTLEEDEMEYGVGIHGEPGVRREKTLEADQLGARMAEEVLGELGYKNSGKMRIAVLVNGLGGTPLQELYILNQSVRKALASYDVEVCYNFTGNYMTSIEMCGASLSILKLDNELEELLQEPCYTPGLKITELKKAREYREEKEEKSFTVSDDREGVKVNPVVKKDEIKLENITYIIQCMMQCIIEHETEFCDMDAFAGDGDFGMSVAKGFRKLQEEWEYLLSQKCNTIGEFLEACSMIIMEHCGGASGPIWGSAFRGAGKAAGTKTSLSKEAFGEMLWQAVEGIQKTGERSFGRGAQVGDKTLIDALVPCAETWRHLAQTDCRAAEIFKEAAAEAVKGAKSTEKIVARMGRAGTVGERSLGHPDAGAYALGIIFTDIAEKLEDGENV